MISHPITTGLATAIPVLMLAFGLGTVPLLWLAQSQFHWLRQKLSPQWLGRIRVTLALSVAVLIGLSCRNPA